MQKNHTQLLLGILIGLLLGLFIGKFAFNTKSEPKQAAQQENNNTANNQNRANRNKDNASYNQENTNGGGRSAERNTDREDYSQASNSEVPQKAIETLAYIKANGKAPEGYVGGRVFQNREKQLPMTNNQGEKINYQEWDVNPKVQGVNRGTQRLVTGDDGRSWYTGDHYKTFTLIKQ